MDVLVVGGGGYFGACVVEHLRRCDGVRVRVASRRSVPPIDLRRPETFEALSGADVVINCTDSVGASPVPAAKHVLAKGGVWMDMGAAPDVAEQLLALEALEPKGHVVVGVGIFPGMLTMLGTYVAELVKPCHRIDLGVRLSALSGAGPGNCRLMVELIDRPGYDFYRDERRARPALGPTRDIAFPQTGPASATAITLPDTLLVRRITKAPTVASHLALSPAWIGPMFRMTQWVLDHAGPLRALVLWMTHLSLRVLRGILLRRVGSRVQLTAIANEGRPDRTARTLDFADGRDGTAMGVAAAVMLWRDLQPPPPGVYAAAALFGIDESLVRLAGARLSPPPLVDPDAPPRPDAAALRGPEL